jgi:hypothetical protein
MIIEVNRNGAFPAKELCVEISVWYRNFSTIAKIPVGLRQIPCLSSAGNGSSHCGSCAKLYSNQLIERRSQVDLPALMRPLRCPVTATEV